MKPLTKFENFHPLPTTEILQILVLWGGYGHSQQLAIPLSDTAQTLYQMVKLPTTVRILYRFHTSSICRKSQIFSTP